MKKKSTAEYAETTEIFLCNEKLQIILWAWTHLSLSTLRGSRQEDEMKEEEAESAEIVPGKPPGRFDLPGGVRKNAAFPPSSCL